MLVTAIDEDEPVFRLRSAAKGWSVRHGLLQQCTTTRPTGSVTSAHGQGRRYRPLQISRMNKGSRHMQRVFQAVAWLLAFAIVVLSLGPPSVRPSTGAAHGLEHLLIFLATGVAFGFGYPHRLWFLAIAQVTFAGAIEVAQNWVPGRHARMSDFLVDTAASCVGVGLSYLLLKFGPRLFRR